MSSDMERMQAVVDELDALAATYGKKFWSAVRDPEDARDWLRDVLEGLAADPASEALTENRLLRAAMSEVEDALAPDGACAVDFAQDPFCEADTEDWVNGIVGAATPPKVEAANTRKAIKLAEEVDVLAAAHGPLFWESVREDQVAWWLESIVTNIKKAAVRASKES